MSKTSWLYWGDLTKHTGHEAEGEVWGEQSEEPGGGVQAGPDLLLLQVAVQISVVVVKQPRQLVHLNLTDQTRFRHITSIKTHLFSA